MNPFSYTADSIAEITGGKLLSPSPEGTSIKELLIDSRRLVQPEATLFIALVSGRNDGHRYIRELYEKGVRNFLVS
ncbi:MAG TPA: hypothetical protein VMC08_05165, partial [Bacteroidales bacterium]|nr:hypothetical protein [Bacteroidales bacterium]